MITLHVFFGYAEVEIGRLHIVPSVTLFTFQIKFTMLFYFSTLILFMTNLSESSSRRPFDITQTTRMSLTH